MKILVVNLLRLGDVIAMAPALKAIGRKYPNAEIHLLVNSNFEAAARRLNGVGKTIRFERDRLQSACVEAERPMFEAYDWIRGFVDEMCEESYDLMFNFTHNRLSGWLCGLIEAKAKVGLVLDGSGAVSFGSAWFKHLNQQVDFDDVQAFNHTDIFIGAAGGWDHAFDISFFDDLLKESEEGRAEVASLFGREMPSHENQISSSHRIVAFQLSTSDPKKEWGDNRFRALAAMILNRHLDATIYVLGAPDERARIEEFCRSVEAQPSRIQPAILSLAGLVSFLEESDLLVTGDTSVKHFAAASPTRIVELIIGSADAYRTGSWKAGDILLASRELCAPCGHTEPCHRTSHACALAISPDAVAETVLSFLAEEAGEVRYARLRSMRGLQAFEVDRSEGLASLIPVQNEALTDAELALSLERASRRLALEIRDGRFEKLRFGSEILKVKRALMRKFSTTGASEIRFALADGEQRLRHAEGIVQSLKIQLSRLKESIQDPKRMHEMVSSVAVMRSRLQKNPWTRFVAEPLIHIIEDDRSAPFARFRKLSDSVLDLEQRLEIGLKLIRGLETEFENENQGMSSMGDRL